MEYPLKGVLHGYLRYLLFFTAGLEYISHDFKRAPTISAAALCVGASFAPCPLARTVTVTIFTLARTARATLGFSEEAGKPLEAVGGSVAPENP